MKGTIPYKPLIDRDIWRLLLPTCLWRSDDHILLRIVSGYTENYRRFYFRDIQAIVVRKTAEGMIYNITWAVLIALLMLVLATAEAPRVVWWCVLAVPLLLLARNITLGPTCVCHVRTAVSSQRLLTVKRLNRAQKLLDVVWPLVFAAQADLPTEPAQPIIQTETGPTGQLPWQAPVVQPKIIKNYSGRIHAILFAVLLLDALLFGACYFADKYRALAGIVMLLLLVQLALAIVATVKQAGTNITTELKATVWLTIVYVGVVYLLSMSTLVIDDIAGHHISEQEAILDSSSNTGIVAFAAICSGVLGLAGLIQLVLFARSAKRLRSALPPKSPAPPTAANESTKG